MISLVNKKYGREMESMFTHRLDTSLNSKLVCLPFERVLFFYFFGSFCQFILGVSPKSVKLGRQEVNQGSASHG